MAEVKLKIYDASYRKRVDPVLEGFIDKLEWAANYTHYGASDVQPGDVTVTMLDIVTRGSRSDSLYELEIEEGSDNWPDLDKASAEFPESKDPLKDYLDRRARRMSYALTSCSEISRVPHNVFDKTGPANGWFQRKSDFPEGPELNTAAIPHLSKKWGILG